MFYSWFYVTLQFERCNIKWFWWINKIWYLHFFLLRKNFRFSASNHLQLVTLFFLPYSATLEDLFIPFWQNVFCLLYYIVKKVVSDKSFILWCLKTQSCTCKRINKFFFRLIGGTARKFIKLYRKYLLLINLSFIILLCLKFNSFYNDFITLM